MGNVVFDTTDFDKGMAKLQGQFPKQVKMAVEAVADELLRLANFEVPHDTGALQNSGHVEMKKDEAIVGYNKVYAAKMHENPQFNFQKGRKGKYLEDPLKRNLQVFNKFFSRTLGKLFK